MTTPKSYQYKYSIYGNKPFLRGVGSVFDLSGSVHLFGIMGDPNVTDFEAIMSDWLIVGEDIKKAIVKNKPSVNEKRK